MTIENSGTVANRLATPLQVSRTPQVGIDHSSVIELVEAVGDQTFGRILHEWLNRDLGLEHTALDRYDLQLRPVSISRYSITGQSSLEQLRLEYRAANLFSSDPAVERVRMLAGATVESTPVLIRSGEDKSSGARQRAAILEQHGLAERIAVIFAFRNRWITLKLFRSANRGAADVEEITALEKSLPLLLPIIGWHVILSSSWTSLGTNPNISQYEVLLRNLEHSLSKREIEVCARAMFGMSNQETAASLGIKEGSVRTFRTRAYAKLEISTVQHLFVKCMANLNGR